MAEVLFVGTGDAFGSGGRRSSAILVRAGGRALLLDCGPSSLIGLKELGIDPRDLDGIVVSHFHGDHCAGVPFLLLDARYQSPRSRPLAVVGPPGIERRVQSMNDIFAYSRNAGHPVPTEFAELTTDRELEVAGFRVRAFHAHHTPETSPYMVGISTGDAEIFFTGDTGWHDALPDCVGRADLLITECTLFEPEWEYHMSYQELAQRRDQFRAERIILTHLGKAVLDERDRVQFDLAEDGLLLRV